MEWTQEEDDTLRRLASEGLTASQIGDRVGRTKNMIVGRARRIGAALLRPKCTELHKITAAQWKKIEDLAAVGCGPTEIKDRIGYTGPRQLLADRILRRSLQQTPPDRPPVTVIRLRVAPGSPRAPASNPLPSCTACQWLSMDGPPWVFCGEPTMPGRPYCEMHVRRAYVRVCERAGDAA